MEKYPCFICKTVSNIAPVQNSDSHFVECIVCGRYIITDRLEASNFLDEIPAFRISAGIRSLENPKKPPTLSTSNIQNIADLVRPPSNPIHAIDLILQYIVSHSGRGDRYVILEPKVDYPIICAQDPNEFDFYLCKALDLKYLEQSGGGFRLSLEGWQRYSSLQINPKISKKVFVAMWFDNSMDEPWQNGFSRAISECGFEPIRIDLQQHNEKICDRIIAEIRECSFIVADFTGQRGGVYYEAGFAMGLGRPVIWTVKRSDIANLHFDTRQYNHIAWDTSGDLFENLKDRIRATIGK